MDHGVCGIAGLYLAFKSRKIPICFANIGRILDSYIIHSEDLRICPYNLPLVLLSSPYSLKLFPPYLRTPISHSSPIILCSTLRMNVHRNLLEMQSVLSSYLQSCPPDQTRILALPSRARGAEISREMYIESKLRK